MFQAWHLGGLYIISHNHHKDLLCRFSVSVSRSGKENFKMFREFPVVPKITNDRARDYCGNEKVSSEC